MINQTIVDILVKRILTGGINPKTNGPMKVDDIKIEEYRNAVIEELSHHLVA